MRWNGTRWSLSLPATFPSDTLFTGVDTLADGSAWAVGFQTTANGDRRTLIEHASGGMWTQVTSPNVATSTDNSLMAVSGTQATGLWAVGYWLSPTGLQPLVLRYDTTRPSPHGSNWSHSPVPGAGLLRKVRAVASGKMWAAGGYYNASEQHYQTLAVYFDGTKWATVVSANGHSDNEIIGLATDPAGSMITAVGRLGPDPLIEQANCPKGPVSLPTRAPAPVPPVPTAPGVGPSPGPPPKTPPPKTPIPVTITDQAAAAGISGHPDWSFSAAVADFTGDGWPDLFISHHWHPANLWINKNGTFSAADVSFFSSILDRHDCQPALHKPVLSQHREGLVHRLPCHGTQPQHRITVRAHRRLQQ